MVTACLNCNLITENMEEIKIILKKRFDIKDEENKSKTDLKDILIISKAMYNVMNQSQQKDFKNLTFTGKHILVTLGQRGVLWCGPGTGSGTGIKNTVKNNLKNSIEVKANIKENKEEISKNTNENGTKTVNHDFSSNFSGSDRTTTWFHIPAVPLTVSTDPTISYILNTNGAGDAFCSGFIRGILNNNDIENCVKLGLLSSHSKILFTSGMSR